MKSDEGDLGGVHHDHAPYTKPIGLNHMPRDQLLEVQRLKELCLLHVDCMEKQSQEIAAKDKKIKELTLQIEKYKARLRGKKRPHEKKKSSIRPKESRPTSESIGEESKASSSIKKEVKESYEPPKKRKRLVLEDEGKDVYEAWLKDVRETCRVRGTERDLLALKAQSVVLFDKPALTSQPIFSEFLEGNQKSQLKEIPVPAWWFKILPPAYQIEGTEDIEEDTFFKRHQKHETMERRRKKWDMQRLREETQKEKLQERDKKKEFGQAKNAREMVTTFFPDAKQIRYIEVADEVPVPALGASVPQIEPRCMRLSWSSSKKSTI